MSKKIGFIGVGMMGHGIAKNLLEKGFPVTAMAHRNRAPLEDLLAKGAAGSNHTESYRRELPRSLFSASPGSPQVEQCSLWMTMTEFLPIAVMPDPSSLIARLPSPLLLTANRRK